MPSKKQRQLLFTLQKFYQKPVAKVSLELFLSIFTILFFAIFAIRPTLLTMSDLIKEIDDKEKIDQDLSKKIAALSTVQPLYLQLSDQLIALDEVIPNQPQLISSLKVIEKTASDLGLVIDNMAVSEIPPISTQQEEEITPDSMTRIDIPIVINVSGDYPTIRQFTQDLRDYRRSFIVDTIIFNTKKLQGSTKLEARITLSAPYFGADSATAQKR